MTVRTPDGSETHQHNKAKEIPLSGANLVIIMKLVSFSFSLRNSLFISEEAQRLLENPPLRSNNIHPKNQLEILSTEIAKRKGEWSPYRAEGELLTAELWNLASKYMEALKIKENDDQIERCKDEILAFHEKLQAFFNKNHQREGVVVVGKRKKLVLGEDSAPLDTAALLKAFTDITDDLSPKERI